MSLARWSWEYPDLAEASASVNRSSACSCRARSTREAAHSIARARSSSPKLLRSSAALERISASVRSSESIAPCQRATRRALRAGDALLSFCTQRSPGAFSGEPSPQCSRTGEPRAAHGSRLYGRGNGAREDGRVLRDCSGGSGRSDKMIRRVSLDRRQGGTTRGAREHGALRQRTLARAVE